MLDHVPPDGPYWLHLNAITYQGDIMNTIKMQNLIAFIESHGNKVVGNTEDTITATLEIRDAAGDWATSQETFPATVKATRDWLGY